jgi:hypothetical protein
VYENQSIPEMREGEQKRTSKARPFLGGRQRNPKAGLVSKPRQTGIGPKAGFAQQNAALPHKKNRGLFFGAFLLQ